LYGVNAFLFLLPWHKQIVGVTPHPILALLGRAHHGVLAGVIMLGSVPLRRGIATTREPTGLAGAQVYPGTAHFDTIYAYAIVVY
jgi:hypothetical protein